MTAKTARPAADRRDQLKTAYLIAFDNFATTAPEVAEVLGVKPAEATKLLKSMGSLITWDRVNGERTLTYQATETYDSLSREEAIAKFDATYPEQAPSHKGATGPRYTDEQIKAGLKALRAGKTARQIADAAGVKSEGYFKKVLKEIDAEQRGRGAKSAKVRSGRANDKAKTSKAGSLNLTTGEIKFPS